LFLFLSFVRDQSDDPLQVAAFVSFSLFLGGQLAN